MSPSSLVFAAIVGVWAVYLVPQWLRRRHELAQARAAESGSARVLAPRRRPVETRESTGPVLHGAAVAATSVAVKPVAVKPVAAAPVVTAPPRTAVPLQVPDRPRPAGVRPPRSVQEVAARAAARRRARVLLLLVLSTVAGWVLVALQLTAWPAGVPATALLMLDLVALRAAARRRRDATAARATRPAPVTQRRREPVAAPQVSGRPVEPPVEETAPPVEEAVPAASIGWTPVPVPVPLYTLKPMAPRWDLAPRERPMAFPDPVPAVAEEDFAPMGLATLDLDAVLERRRAVNG